MKKIIRYILLIVLVVPAMNSCTDLEEIIIDKTTGEENLVEENMYEIVAPAYNNFNRLFWHFRWWGFQETTTDECFFPTRGTDWFDGGVWQQQYLHIWTPQHRDVVDNWNELSIGMARANYSMLLISEFEQTQEVKYFKAELSFLVSFFMYNYLDLYGQVPYRNYTETNFSVNPKVYQRTEAFNVITGKLRTIIPELGNRGDVPYGRITKDAARMLLAKLYLNKEVYTGDASNALDSCIFYVNGLLNSGEYALADDYFGIFKPENHLNYRTATDEAILVCIQQDLEPADLDNNMSYVQVTLHYNQVLNGKFSTNWNGYCATESYIRSLIAHTDTATDVRWHDSRLVPGFGVNIGFIYGQQYSYTGSKLTDRYNNPLIYTFEVPLDPATETNGVRVLKYFPKPDPIQAQRYDNDFVVFRIADALLMRAECYYRKGQTDLALADINTLRAKRNTSTIAIGQLTEDFILAERAIELYYEGFRRQDMIRFGKFLDPKDNKPEASPATRLVLPIPQAAIDAIDDESLLKQNPGY
jgi:hypothetical protein